MRFAHPYFLLLLIIIPLVIRHLSQKRKRGVILYPGLGTLKAIKPADTVRFKNTPLALRLLVLVLIILALARPQSGKGEEEITTKGIDIMLAIDVSGSMSTNDIEPNRLEGAKKVAQEFVSKRKSDRIGLVVFAGNSFTQSPLTLDYGVLNNLIEAMEIGMTEDGTAIGMAIATSVNRLRESKATSRIAILLTDGVNNRGSIDPETAANLANAVGIKIYTVAVGREGVAYQVVNDPLFGKRRVPVQTVIDEETLKMIASKTGGRYYRATDLEELRQIYSEIDTLEKVEIKSEYHVRYTELFPYLVYPALFLLLLEMTLVNTVLRRVP